MVVEYHEMLAWGCRECGYTTHVDEIGTGVDVYFAHVVVCYCEYTVDTRGTTVGNGMATAEGGETSEEERAGATGR
jgi:hypothetical protein